MPPPPLVPLDTLVLRVTINSIFSPQLVLTRYLAISKFSRFSLDVWVPALVPLDRVVPLDTSPFHLGFNLQPAVTVDMSDPIRQGISEELHALSFEEDIACDYHDRPKTISKDEVLIEAIRLIDHPQLRLEEWPDGWILDAARCSEHAVESIEAPTKGFNEALVILPVNRSNNVVSIDAPEPSDVNVIAFSPASKGSHPMTISQMLMDAADPDDVGIARWVRLKGALDGAPDPMRKHIERLIEQSREVPTSFN